MTAPTHRSRDTKRALVRITPDGLPAVVEAAVAGLDLLTWLAGARDTVQELALTAGAVLLRGFEPAGVAGFRAAMDHLCGAVLDYGERSSPRTEITEGVYTSTEHPADQPIVLHNEQSYTRNWPMRIAFYCDVAPGDRGRTPLADSRRVLARLSSATVAGFAREGVRYVRNYLPGISLSWQEAFQTAQRSDVERYCAAEDIRAEWIGADQLRTYQVRPAIHHHPQTGERTWFNHALFFNVSSLPAEVSSALREALDEADLPYHTYYGDGGPIDPVTIEEVRAAYAAETTAFDWRQGDLLLVENMLVAHGREPFTGPRRILAAMGDPFLASVGEA